MVSDHWPSRNGFEALLPVADLLGGKHLEVRSVVLSPDKPARLNWKMNRRCSRDVRMLRFPARADMIDLYIYIYIDPPVQAFAWTILDNFETAHLKFGSLGF